MSCWPWSFTGERGGKRIAAWFSQNCAARARRNIFWDCKSKILKSSINTSRSWWRASSSGDFCCASGAFLGCCSPKYSNKTEDKYSTQTNYFKFQARFIIQMIQSKASLLDVSLVSFHPWQVEQQPKLRAEAEELCRILSYLVLFLLDLPWVTRSACKVCRTKNEVSLQDF